MAYKAKDQFFPPTVDGNTRTSGSSLTLGVGEVAFVDISKTTKQNGVKILSDFSPLDPTAKLAIRMGEPNDYTSRSESNKDISTIPFTLKDIAKIYVDAPERAGILVDDFVIGFNGEDGSEIDIDNAENEQFQVTLSGDLMGMIGLPDRKHTANINLTAPIDGVKGTDWTMHEIVENAYLELKNYKLPGNIPITDYVDVLLVNSENPSTIPGTATTFYNLTVKDNGYSIDLGKVQAQYPTLDVKKLEWSEVVGTTYSVIAEATEEITAGAFVIGSEYVITAVGTTDFTAIGASANTVGVTFTATGVGTGTGTANTVAMTAYQPKADFALKGCEDCPTGYTTLAQGFVYEVTLANDGVDATATVQALPGATAGTAILNDTVGDTTIYSVVTDDALTQAEIDTFIGSNLTATINLIATDVVDLCESPTPASIAWTVGESCNATTEAYSITLKDTECGDSRLTELQAAFPDLTIAEVATTLDDCQRTYTTTVNTSLVCEECGDIFRDIFTSEAPGMFDGIGWTKTAKVYSGTAKMGIRVRGKEAKIGGNTLMMDDMPFFWGSVEISLAGGYPTWTNESYLSGTNDRFTVKYFSRKADAQNLGGNLRKFEEEAQMHFRGRGRYTDNNYAKLVSGQETRLEAFSQYLTYSITIAPHNYVSNFQQPQNGANTYHFIVPLGKQEVFEGVVNKLAAAAGLPQVQAVSK